MGCLLSSIAVAQTPLPPEESDVPSPEFRYFACDQDYGSDKDAIDSTREGLDELICEAHLWLDGLLGDQADIYAARRSHGRLSMGTEYSERQGWAFKLRLRVRVTLPALRNRLSAFIGREPDDDYISGRSDSLALREEFPVLEDEDRWLAGLGYELPTGYRLRSSLRVGANHIESNPYIFVRNRFYWNALITPSYVLNLRFIPFWTNQDDLGYTVGFDFAMPLSAVTLYRMDLVGTQSGNTEEYAWRWTNVIYRSLGPEVGLAMQLFMTGDSGEEEPLREYGARALLRFPLSPKRLYMLLAAGPGWYQPGDASVDRERYFTYRLTIELPFGL